MDTSLFCSLLDITKEEFSAFLNKNWSNNQYNKSSPFTFQSKIEPETFARFQEHHINFQASTLE